MFWPEPFHCKLEQTNVLLKVCFRTLSLVCNNLTILRDIQGLNFKVSASAFVDAVLGLAIFQMIGASKAINVGYCRTFFLPIAAIVLFVPCLSIYMTSVIPVQ